MSYFKEIDTWLDEELERAISTIVHIAFIADVYGENESKAFDAIKCLLKEKILQAYRDGRENCTCKPSSKSRS